MAYLQERNSIALAKKLAARRRKPFSLARGTIFSLVAIPLTIIIACILGPLFPGTGAAYVGIFGMPIAMALFDVGSRRSALTGKGFRLPIAIGAVATILGAIAGYVAQALASFLAVGGHGGLFGSSFATVLANKLSANPAELVAAAILIPLMSIALIHARSEALRRAHEQAFIMDHTHDEPHETSAGVILNGKPLET